MFSGVFQVGGFALEDLRIFGGPSLANLIEIPIAAILGVLSAVGLAIMKLFDRIQEEKSVSRWVIATYGVAVLFYLMMPGLPE